jgi:hypothetical protein
MQIRLILGLLAVLLSPSMLLAQSAHSSTQTPYLPPEDSRREADYRFVQWCSVDKALPVPMATCFCIADQFHIQGLSTGAMHEVLGLIHMRESGGNPPFEQLSPADYEKFSRAFNLCGAQVK